MKALITGASSGIGREMAFYLGELGYELILVARREDRLKEIQDRVRTKVTIVPLDLGIEQNVYQLYEYVKNENIDMLINNAGFGLFGNTNETDLNRELEMINLNIKTLHILTKLFLKDFVAKDSGYILNVGSSAGFLAGPKLNTYYATKNYVVKFTMAIYEELRRQNSNVHVSVLCPGPVNTEFNQVAGGFFNVGAKSAAKVAKLAIRKTLDGKLIIVPGIGVKLGLFFNRFIPYKLSMRIVYKIQDRKNKDQ